MESYAEVMGRPPGFRVTYRLFTAEEGGRWMPPHQHIKWNFRYDDKSIHTGTFMIWPEFLGLDGKLLPAGEVPPLGQADMFFFGPGPQELHRQHIRPGVRGYFVEGSRRMGVCEVVEVLGLYRKLKS